MKERLQQLKLKLKEIWEVIQESEAYQQLKEKYDELDSQTKLYIHLGTLGGSVLLVLISILVGMAKVSSLKSEINERETLIGYLQNSADTIKQLRAQSTTNHEGADAGMPVTQLVEGALPSANIDHTRVEIGQERPGGDDKDTQETLVDVRLSQVNLRQIMKLMFYLTEQGKSHALNVKDLDIDTHSDPAGYMDASLTVATYKAKEGK